MADLVTIIIPNYNGIHYLDDCIQSLYRQTLAPNRIIIVDNHSEDGSASWLKEHYPEITLLESDQNTGFSCAVNRGIIESSSKYCVLLNNDIICDDNFVSKLITAIEADERIFSVQAKMLNMKNPSVIDDAGDFYCAFGWAFAPGKGSQEERFSVPIRVFSCCAGAAVYRKALFSEIGLFDEQHFAYLEDVDIGYRALLHGYENRMEPEAVVLHAGSASSGSRYNSFKCRLAAANSIWLIYKNMPWWQILLNLPFLVLGMIIKQFFYLIRGMGKVYFKGVCVGLRRCTQKGARQSKVSMKQGRWKYACRIQLSLWRNIFRLIG